MIGQLIKGYRKQEGLSQEEFANLLGFAPDYVACIEGGVTEPDFLFNVRLLETMSDRSFGVEKTITKVQEGTNGDG